jgi:UDP-N-acetylmuramate-alanine ligase
MESYLKTHTREGDIILTMGAGDLYKVGETLLKNNSISV